MKFPLMQFFALALLAAGVFFLSLWGLNAYNNYQHSLMSPTTRIAQALEGIAHTSTNKSGDKKIVYGFLPYWNMKTAQIPQTLTHVGYFSISIDAKGNIVTRESNYTEPGWNTYNSANFDKLRDTTAAQGHN
jgi:hypothetical protein